MLKILKAESGRGLLRVNASPGQRNRKLRAALEWSHRLLTTEQQTVFRRLGVMSGSFDMSAAQQICAEPDAGEWEVLGTLAALVDKSLVVADSRPGAEPRFHLLETMRHLALDRLNAAAEETPLRECHLAHFLKLAESASEPLGGPQQGEWLKRLDLERDKSVRRASRLRQCNRWRLARPASGQRAQSLLVQSRRAAAGRARHALSDRASGGRSTRRALRGWTH